MCSFAACMESFYHLSPLGRKRGGRAKSSEAAKVACLLASPAFSVPEPVVSALIQQRPAVIDTIREYGAGPRALRVTSGFLNPRSLLFPEDYRLLASSEIPQRVDVLIHVQGMSSLVRNKLWINRSRMPFSFSA